jgi:hypothetical protein
VNASRNIKLVHDQKKAIGNIIRDWVQFVLLLFASVWGAYTFVYKEIIVPANRPATLAISGSLDELGCKGNFVLVRARISAANKKDVRIYAPALWFTMRGQKITTSNELDQGGILSQTNDNTVPQIFTKYSRVQSDVIAAWRLPSWEIWYDPGDETTNDELFYVPSDIYQALKLEVGVIITRNIDAIASVNWTVTDDGSFDPKLMIKPRKHKGDSEINEPFDSEKNSRHRDWELKYGTGYNWAETTISLLPNGAIDSRKIPCGKAR